MKVVTDQTVEALNKAISEYLEQEKNLRIEAAKKISALKYKRRHMERARDSLLNEKQYSMPFNSETEKKRKESQSDILTT